MSTYSQKLAATNRYRVYAAFNQGILKTAGLGNVVLLPSPFASVSSDGKAYFTQHNFGQCGMLFLPTMVGENHQVQGYLFCNKDLNSADLSAYYPFQDAKPPPPHAIQITYPHLDSNGSYVPRLYQVFVIKQTGKNEYFVMNQGD